MKSSHSQEELRAQVYERLGQIALSLGSPGRLKLIQLLAQAPRTVDALSRMSGQSVANTSQHLQRLAKDGLVICSKEGLNRVYRIRNPKVLMIWETLQELAHEIAHDLNEAEEELVEVAELGSELPARQVLKDFKGENAVLLDVRDEVEAQNSPVKGAIAIPLAQLKERIKALPQKKIVYVFCRGRYCHLASDAVRLLRAEGFKAFRLQESAFKLNQVLKSGKDVA